jgi:glutathione S-transferase
MFSETLYAKLAPLFQFTLPVTHGTLEEEDKDYFRRTREALLGKTLEEALPSGPDRVEKWAALKAAFDDIDRWIGDAQYFTGSKIAFADLDIAGFLLWCRRIWGTGSDEWKEVAGWHHGRWANLVKSLEAYEKLA